MSVTIKAVDIETVAKFFEQAPDIAKKAMSMSINQIATRRAVPDMRKEMERQVAFPRGYLSSDRFDVTRTASPDNLEAAISGRDRPTSLARFQQYRDVASSRGKALRVEVKPGQGKLQDVSKVFLVTLKNNNIGLAVRLREGGAPNKAYKPTLLDAKRNVWLLYGPSVDQVFRSVADDNMKPIQEAVVGEFERQFARMIND